MRYALFGINGVYNFGCEAIVRGSKIFLQAIDPKAEITYYSFNYDYDRKALSDLDLNIVNIKRDRSIVKRAINKVVYRAGSDKQILLVDYQEMVQKNDYLISIGGDIYTIPAVLREKKKYHYYNELIEVGKKFIGAGKRVIVYGASVGPFGKYKPAIGYYRQNLDKYKVIICREEESVNYLKKLGMHNYAFLPDPAFLVKGDTKPYYGERPYIGINFSPLSLREVYGNVGKDSSTLICDIVNAIKKKTGKEILLIPHVVSKNEGDDDLSFLTNIARQTNSTVADTTKGFLGIKEQLQECCLVASARMHCCLNALAENIPTIFVSYSQKSIGMCEYVYGDKKWVVDLKNIKDELPPKIEMIFKDREPISEEIKKRNLEIYDYYNNHLSDIKSLIYDSRDKL